MSDISYLNLNPPNRVLLAPGPSNLPPRVQRALIAPLVGHLDPYFVQVMEDTVKLLRTVFRTQNNFTIPISGTGSAGMNASFCNFLEPGDVAVIGVNGFFAERMVDNAQRTGAKVVTVPAEWGKIIEPDALEAALKAEKKVKLLALVHVETSTGAMQPLIEAAKLARKYDALLVVDAVSSLGGQELATDDWGIDICYSGSQKCLSAPPGLAPFTASQKAMTVAEKRSTKVASWYFDLSLLATYWVTGRFYHHTAPVLMIYALHEALVLMAEEGLDARIKRHLRNGAALQAGLEAMGLVLHADKNHRASVVTAVRVPQGVEEARVRQGLLNEFGIEIAGGLGQLKGKIWRIGLMGYSSSEENVLRLLMTLEKLLTREGYKVEPNAGVRAALEVFSKK